MSKLIEKFFGDPSSLTKITLEEKLIGEEENLELEFKTIWDDQSKKERKNTIINPLVSILNSNTGNGVLCLGVATGRNNKIAERIDGVDKSWSPCNSITQLSSTIKSNIGSIPPYTENFRLYIEEVDIGNNKYVFFIEIERADKYCVYYSKISGVSLLRTDDEDKSLSMENFYDLVAKRTYARLSINFNYADHNNNIVDFYVSYRNKGFKPGKNVHTVFICCSDQELSTNERDILYFGCDISSHKEILEEFGIFDEIQAYKNKKIFTSKPSKSDHYSPDIIYPTHFSPHDIGVISLVTSEPFELMFFILIFEEQSLTVQKVIINKVSDISIQQVDLQFKPYIGG